MMLRNSFGDKSVPSRSSLTIHYRCSPECPVFRILLQNVASLQVTLSLDACLYPVIESHEGEVISSGPSPATSEPNPESALEISRTRLFQFILVVW